MTAGIATVYCVQFIHSAVLAVEINFGFVNVFCQIVIT